MNIESSTIDNPGKFKIDDSGSYDPYAVDYHEGMERLTRPFLQTIVKHSHLCQGQRLLDVGTGTGIVANYVAGLLNQSGFVTGIDLSRGMIDTSNNIAQKAGLRNVEFLRMDAEALDLPDKFLDTVLSMQAFMHFPDAGKALSEIHRVLKPGGRLVVSLGCSMPHWMGGRLRAYTVGIKRSFVKQFSHNLYGPGFILELMNEYLRDVPEPPHSSWGGKYPAKVLSKLLRYNGFELRGARWHENTIAIESIDDFWRYQIAIVTEARKRLAIAAPDTKKLFYEEFRRRAEASISGGGKLFYCAANFIIHGKKK